MAWQEVDGTKPPYSYDEEELQKEIPKEVLDNERETFTKETITGKGRIQKPIVKKKPVTVFDSSRDNK